MRSANDLKGLRELLARIPIRSSDSLTLLQTANGALKAAEELLELLSCFQDESACRRDHKGSCQEHGFFFLGPDEECPQVSLRRWLGVSGEETGRCDQEVKGTTSP